jgi:hypothetical protein
MAASRAINPLKFKGLAPRAGKIRGIGYIEDNLRIIIRLKLATFKESI